MAFTIEEIKKRHEEGRFVFQLNLEQIKELQQDGVSIIATHSGTPHADDIFACVAFKLNLELGGKKAIIVRTKDQAIVEIADAVIDIGKIYDPEKNRFDHHQEGGAGIHSSGTKKASFGLVWSHLGITLTERYLKSKGYSLSENNKLTLNLFYKIEAELVEGIDAYDCGDAVDDKFRLGEFFAFLRPTFIEREAKTAKPDDMVFEELAGIAELVIKRYIAQFFCDRFLVQRIEESQVIENQVLLLDFAVRMSELSETLNSDQFGYVSMVIINQNPKKGGIWTLNVPRHFQSRFPKTWLGKSGSDFAEACGFADVSFCHPEGFTLTCGSKETAIALAKLCV